jgi:hypothetical protein
MANVSVGRVYNTDRVNLPLVCQIGLGPHVNGCDQLPWAVRRPGGVPFGTTPVCVWSLHSGMCAESRVGTLAPFTELWYSASPNAPQRPVCGRPTAGGGPGSRVRHPHRGGGARVGP